MHNIVSHGSDFLVLVERNASDIKAEEVIRLFTGRKNHNPHVAHVRKRSESIMDKRDNSCRSRLV